MVTVQKCSKSLLKSVHKQNSTLVFCIIFALVIFQYFFSLTLAHRHQLKSTETFYKLRYNGFLQAIYKQNTVLIMIGKICGTHVLLPVIEKFPKQN